MTVKVSSLILPYLIFTMLLHVCVSYHGDFNKVYVMLHELPKHASTDFV